jgi:hypothetical protein
MIEDRFVIGWLLVAACSSNHASDGDRSESAGNGGSGGAASTCPAGVGAWMSTSAEPFSLGRAQYNRCVALCQSAQSSGCAGHDDERCEAYCNGLQNNSVNGRCTEAIEAEIACFEGLNEPCNTPQRSVAGTCQNERDEVRCCFERYCADPANAGTCP